MLYISLAESNFPNLKAYYKIAAKAWEIHAYSSGGVNHMTLKFKNLKLIKNIVTNMSLQM